MSNENFLWNALKLAGNKIEQAENKIKTLQQDRNSMFTKYDTDMDAPEDVSGCETNAQSDIIISSKIQTDIQIDKKNSLTRVYLKSLWYNKLCTKILLTPGHNYIPCANQLLKKVL